MSTEPVDAEAVERVATLARVDLDEDAVEDFVEQFREILGYFDTLEDVPDVESEPELVNVMRADEVEKSLSQEAALQNATESEDGRFKGPRVS
ncbi:MAG: Asp-tRNA(Asn)/Glu-tRNA(Gln) amidotransferase subunit GatC [Halodesulfurarchaeum sp.]